MRTCSITIPVFFMSGGLMIDDIIMNIFSDTEEQEMSSVMIFSKMKDNEIYLYQESLQYYTCRKTITDKNKK